MSNPNLGKSVAEYISSSFYRRKIRTYFDAMDIIRDDYLTLQDYNAVADRIVSNQQDSDKAEAIRKMFFDLFQHLVCAGKPVTAESKVNFDEFLHNTAQCALDEVNARVYARKEKEVFFEYVDTNGNGTISMTEYEQYLAVYFGNHKAKDCETSFASIDVDKNGVISLDEFVDAHYHYWFDVTGDEQTTPLPYGPLVETA